jgi:hypothetical protein
MNRFAGPALLAAVAALVGARCDTIDPGPTRSIRPPRQVAAAGVTRLEVDSSFDVRVTLGQPEAATVTYDSNLASLLDIGVDGRTLRIRLQPHNRTASSPNLTAHVTIGRLEAIRVAGDSAVTVTGTVPGPALRLELSRGSRVAADLELDRADATLSGASRLELTGTTGRLHADGSGTSNLELAGLRLHDLDIRLSGASHANVKADQTIAAQLSGTSRLTYKGSPRFTSRTPWVPPLSSRLVNR